MKLISEAPPSGVPEAAKSSITLVLNPQKDRLPLLRAPGPITSGLTFNGSVNPDLRVKGTSILGAIADHRVNLKIQVTSGTIDAIGIDGSPEKRKSPTLDVRGSVITLSVLQDGHELLPRPCGGNAFLLLYEPELGLLILVGMIAFALFKIVDRAFSVLLEISFAEGRLVMISRRRLIGGGFAFLAHAMASGAYAQETHRNQPPFDLNFSELDLEPGLPVKVAVVTSGYTNCQIQLVPINGDPTNAPLKTKDWGTEPDERLRGVSLGRIGKDRIAPRHRCVRPPRISRASGMVITQHPGSI